MHLYFLLIFLTLPKIIFSLDVFNDDVLGLIVFKASLNDPFSKLVSWNESDDTPCEWFGIYCDPVSKKVTQITLNDLSLSGEISPGLLRLQNLQKISLWGNNFTGEINPGFAKLWSLESVDFSGNKLSGNIPDELFQQCGNLKSVSFANNMLTGNLPPSLGDCMTLQHGNFSGNRISGELPVNIWSLSGLESLNVSNNKLEGKIPDGFESMYSLKVINLSKNAFTGFLPENIGNCLQLQTVDFSENAFSGVIPDTLQKLNICSSVNLGKNKFTGEIPDWFGHMESLEMLDLSMNRFFGIVPFTLGNVRSLKELNLSYNGLVGGLPESLMNCDKLLSVDVSMNMLKGKMPNWIFGLGLRVFSIAGNRFKGIVEYPSGGSNVPSFLSLQVLDLSGNQLSGVIAPEIGGFRQLMYLDLSLNLFVGFIPFQIENCSDLTTLILSKNNLTGPIPLTIVHLTNLEVVDVSNNHLSGDLPKELTNLSRLTSFNISNNNFQGELPAGGFFNQIPLSSVENNPSLCGSVVNQSCPGVHPKPIVLNPNSSTDPSNESSPTTPNSRHRRLMLSISALIAIGAASFIFVGVVIITILNTRFRNAAARTALPLAFSSHGDEFKHSPTSDSQYGKLVMFSGEADFGSGAHTLLNKESELGRGGFGTVYHTIIGDGRSFAIRKLNISSLIKSQDKFEREVANMGTIRHENLVSLEGYYWTSSLQLLINEYVPNGSLFNHLHDDSNETALSWQQRFHTIIGMSKGLAHLHQNNIIHYNIKSSNVLLDYSSGKAKVSDFGLARLLPMLDRYLLSSKIQSALGYMAPEFACRTVKITEKCDVYGFGILLLEIVTGRKPVEYMEDDVIVLCDIVRGALEEGKAEDCIDKRLGDDFVAEEVIPVMKLGLICASQVPSNRPDMSEVVNILELIQCPSEGREDELE